MESQDKNKDKGSSQVPSIVFHPDEKKLARVARIRRLLFLLTFVILGVALIYFITYRPRSPEVLFHSSLPNIAETGLPKESNASRLVPADSFSGNKPKTDDILSQVHQWVVGIEISAQAAQNRWRRAQDLLPMAAVTREQADGALERLDEAQTMLDSASMDVADAEMKAKFIKQTSRNAHGRNAYHFSVIYVAADKYVSLLKKEAKGRHGFLDAFIASLRAVISGDRAEAEIKLNVANSYRCESDNRQRILKRRARQMRQAAQVIFR